MRIDRRKLLEVLVAVAAVVGGVMTATAVAYYLSRLLNGDGFHIGSHAVGFWAGCGCGMALLWLTDRASNYWGWRWDEGARPAGEVAERTQMRQRLDEALLERTRAETRKTKLDCRLMRDRIRSDKGWRS